MKLLTKLLLIHWHYFEHELIKFDKLNFLTGVNASGKSTIIDAIQLILLGDTSGRYFNKAANERGSRKLTGYLMCKQGERYLRNAGFTSYIVLEFFDESKQDYFTAGCCFDVYSASEKPDITFFRYAAAIHSQEFIEEGVPLNRAKLMEFIKQQVNHQTTTNGKEFRDDLYAKLGGLPPRFSELIKKAASFNPAIKIHQFISEFVCDYQEDVDILPMLDSLRSYKRLEQQAGELQKKIAFLERISSSFADFTVAKDNEHLYSFLIKRAEVDMKSEELCDAERTVNEMNKQLEEFSDEISAIQEVQKKQMAEKEAISLECNSNGAIKAKIEYDRQIAEMKQKTENIKSNYESTKTLLYRYISSWRRQAELLLQKIAQTDQPEIANIISNIRTSGQKLIENVKDLENLNAELIVKTSEEGLAQIAACADELRTDANIADKTIKDEQAKLSQELSGLSRELQDLERNSHYFSQEARILKEALKTRLHDIAKEEADVRIVADIVEIKNERWRNVIEGYLHTQKFYILVPQQYFDEAVEVLDNIKREKSVYGIGIVDIARLKEHVPPMQEGSLADEIETTDEDARVFINYTLGKVMKCDNTKQLRNYRTAVTDEGLLYQNFVARVMNPSRWAKPSIGQAAKQKRLEVIKHEIEQLKRGIVACATAISGLKFVREIEPMSESDIGQIFYHAKKMDAVSQLTIELDTLIKDRDGLDMTHAGFLYERMANLERAINESNELLRGTDRAVGETTGRLRALQEEKIPSLHDELKIIEDEISSQYNDESFLETANERYDRELRTRASASEIAKAFPRKKKEAENKKKTSWESLFELRFEYNKNHNMGYDAHALTNEAYEKALTEFSENELPKYQEKINKAEKDAHMQFQEDFISRLQHNIKSAREQIKSLNNAIKNARYGEETYRFKISSDPDNRRFYDMIMDELITHGGFNLYSQEFHDKHKDVIAELFAVITNENNISGEDESIIRDFTDFRKYLSFDLEVHGSDGAVQRLSKTKDEHSGGETQTPFYIAVLASFAQLYRSRAKTNDTARLIIFDEAFSKMDSARIARSIELLREFNFQAIISAPPDRTEIFTEADKVIALVREGTNVHIYQEFGKDGGLMSHG